MSDVDLTEFLHASKHRPGKPCGVALLLDRLDDSQRERFLAACAEPVDRISHAAVVKVLAGWGHEFSRNVLSHHRNGNCSCDR
jgi:hypothetical protein